MSEIQCINNPEAWGLLNQSVTHWYYTVNWFEIAGDFMNCHNLTHKGWGDSLSLCLTMAQMESSLIQLFTLPLPSDQWSPVGNREWRSERRSIDGHETSHQ